jgi:cohesin complex subunit SA-1/2
VTLEQVSKKPRQKKTGTTRAQQVYVVPVDEVMDNYLYDTLESEDGAIVETAKSWIEGFGQTPLQCVKDLVNLVLKASGCEVEIPLHEIEEPDSAPTTLNQLQSQAHKHIPIDYPIVSKDKKFKGFRNRFTEFFSKLLQVSHSSSVLYEDDTLLGHIRTWIVAMSSMGLRAIRHTTTVALLAMMMELCRLRAELQSSISTQERSKKRANAKATKESQERAKKMDKIIDDFYNQVFMHRSKDVDPKIRKDCWKFLGYATRTYRGKYLNSTSLNRFSHALSDPDHNVRLEAIHAIQKLEGPNVEAPLRTFTARFMSRFIKMAVHDSELSVRRALIDLLLEISSNDETSISEDEMKSIISLIFDPDSKIRLGAAKFFVLYVTENQELQDLSTILSKNSLDESWIHFKMLASELKLLAESENDGEDNGSAKDKPLDELRHLFEMSPPTNRIVSVAKSIKEASLAELSTEWSWTSLAEYLRYDLSSISNRKDRQSLGNLQLDDSEKLILLDVLHGFINHWVEGPDLASQAKTKRVRKTKAEIETEMLDVEHAQSQLVEEVPKLLEEFKSSPDAMVKVIRIACLIDHNTYLNPNRETEQNELVKDIIKQYETHSSLDILTECARFFTQALKVKEFEETIKDELDRYLSLAKGDMVHLLQSESFTTEPITPILTRFEYLSYLVDTTKQIDDPINGSARETLGTLLLGSVEKALEIDITDNYLQVLSGVFRCYMLWKLYVFLTEAPSSVNSEEYDAEFFNSILDKIQNAAMIPGGVLKGQDKTPESSFKEAFYTAIKSNVLDMFNALQSLDKQVSPDSYGSKVLKNVDVELTMESKKDIMLMFIIKEREYLREAGTIGRAREDKVDKLVLEHDARFINDQGEENDSGDELDLESDDENEPNGNDEDEENLEIHNSRLLLLDFDLCKLAGKIALAGIVGVIGEDFVKRLKLNSQLLSSKYQRVVINTVVDPKPQTNSKKRRRNERPTAAPAEQPEPADEQQIENQPAEDNDNLRLDDDLLMKDLDMPSDADDQEVTQNHNE